MTGPVLVVGRRGQLASDLQAALTASGRAHEAAGRPDFDLADPDGPARLVDAVRPALIVNAAAYTQVDAAESEPDAARALNADGPGRLAAAAARAGIPLIHVSTDQVFDGAKVGPYTEDDAPAPLCVYGRTKLAGERAVLDACPSALVVRVSWVFGPSGENFVTKVLSWATARPRLSIVCDQHGRPTYSPALAQALLALGERMAGGGAAAPSGILHLAGATATTRDVQARAILEGSRRRGGPHAQVDPVATAAFPTPARRPLNAELDTSRAARLHGIALGPFGPDLDATLDRLIGPARADGGA